MREKRHHLEKAMKDSHLCKVGQEKDKVKSKVWGGQQAKTSRSMRGGKRLRMNRGLGKDARSGLTDIRDTLCGCQGSRGNDKHIHRRMKAHREECQMRSEGNAQGCRVGKMNEKVEGQGVRPRR